MSQLPNQVLESKVRTEPPNPIAPANTTNSVSAVVQNRVINEFSRCDDPSFTGRLRGSRLPAGEINFKELESCNYYLVKKHSADTESSKQFLPRKIENGIHFRDTRPKDRYSMSLKDKIRFFNGDLSAVDSLNVPVKVEPVVEASPAEEKFYSPVEDSALWSAKSQSSLVSSGLKVHEESLPTTNEEQGENAKPVVESLPEEDIDGVPQESSNIIIDGQAQPASSFYESRRLVRTAYIARLKDEEKKDINAAINVETSNPTTVSVEPILAVEPASRATLKRSPRKNRDKVHNLTSGKKSKHGRKNLSSSRRRDNTTVDNNDDFDCSGSAETWSIIINCSHSLVNQDDSAMIHANDDGFVVDAPASTMILSEAFPEAEERTSDDATVVLHANSSLCVEQDIGVHGILTDADITRHRSFDHANEFYRHKEVSHGPYFIPTRFMENSKLAPINTSLVSAGEPSNATLSANDALDRKINEKEIDVTRADTARGRGYRKLSNFESSADLKALYKELPNSTSSLYSALLMKDFNEFKKSNQIVFEYFRQQQRDLQTRLERQHMKLLEERKRYGTIASRQLLEVNAEQNMVSRDSIKNETTKTVVSQPQIKVPHKMSQKQRESSMISRNIDRREHESMINMKNETQKSATKRLHQPILPQHVSIAEEKKTLGVHSEDATNSPFSPQSEKGMKHRSIGNVMAKPFKKLYSSTFSGKFKHDIRYLFGSTQAKVPTVVQPINKPDSLEVARSQHGVKARSRQEIVEEPITNVNKYHTIFGLKRANRRSHAHHVTELTFDDRYRAIRSRPEFFIDESV